MIQATWRQREEAKEIGALHGFTLDEADVMVCMPTKQGK